MMPLLLHLSIACSHPSSPLDSGKGGGPDDTGDSGANPDTAETGDTDTGIPAAVVCDRTLPWSYVAAGASQTCGVHIDGCAECWGAGEDNMGPSYEWNGEDRPPAGIYRSIHMLRYSDWTTGKHNCGIQTDGTAVCFGRDNYGETALPTGDYVDIAVATDYIMAVTTDANLVWAGAVDPVPPTGSFTRVEIDDNYILLLELDGSLSTYKWPSEFVDQRPGPYIAMSRASYPNGVCAVTAEGAVEFWTDNDSTLEAYVLFASLAPTSGMTDVCLAASELSACALASDGHIECWANSSGFWLLQDVPTRTDFVQLACGAAHACALTSGGEIECWGHDIYGETIPPT